MTTRLAVGDPLLKGMLSHATLQVATVKLSQEASEAAAAAVLEARAGGASEEEVKAAATTAAAEIAAQSELVSLSRHHVGDAQSRYYRWVAAPSVVPDIHERDPRFQWDCHRSQPAAQPGSCMAPWWRW